MKSAQVKKSTTKRTSKTIRKEIVVSPVEAVECLPLKTVDVRGIEEGNYWIPDKETGELVNMLVDPARFDALICQYGTLIDRDKWVPLHRKWITDDAHGDIPMYYIAPEKLTPALLAARAACHPKQEQESPQVEMLMSDAATDERVTA